MAELIYYPKISDWWTATVKVAYTATYNTETNQTTVTFGTVSHQYLGRSGYGSKCTTNITVTANDNASSNGTASLVLEKATTGGSGFTLSGTPSPVSVVVQHSSEPGVKMVTIAGSSVIYVAPTSASTTQQNVYGNGSAILSMYTIQGASTIGASDANIGATSMIAVDRNSSEYTHSIKYEFGKLSGYITSSGGVSTTEVKLSATSIAFKVPTSFYAQIPSAKTGICKLTCTTYSGTEQVEDAQTATFTVTAAESACKPSVSGTVVDSNETTKALTGDASKLVRFKSDALCTIEAEAKNSATISQKKIGGTAVSGDTRTLSEVEADSVAFQATDSRGYTTSVSVDVDMIPYVKLTNNPELVRTDATSGNAVLTVKGNYYNGSFGSEDNSLTIKYRAAPVGGEYGDYVTVENPTIVGNTYSVEAEVSGLNYLYAYTVEVVVTDKLEEVTKTALVNKGIPIADWGENDFNFNVDLLLSGTNIIDIIFPIGAAYLSVSGTLPAALSAVATWESITTGISGIYGWKRTA